MRGTILVNYEEFYDGRGLDNITVTVNGQVRKVIHNDTTKQYSTYVNTGEVVTIAISSISNIYKVISVLRNDFTNDDEDGDLGIKQTSIGSSAGYGSSVSYTFTASTINAAFNFQYILNCTSSIECFDLGSGFSGHTSGNQIPSDVWDIEIHEGKMYVAGNFRTYKGTNVSRLVRLNLDGDIDNTFNQSFTTGYTYVSDIKIYNNKIIGVGYETGAGYYTLFRLNIDGTQDNTFTNQQITGVATSANDEEVLAIQSDGKIIVGTNMFGASPQFFGKTGIGRFNTDGTPDSTFNSSGIGFPIDAPSAVPTDVKSIYVYPDDKLLVVGRFFSYNGLRCNSVIRLNADGSLDTTFYRDTTNYGSISNYIYDCSILSNGKILLGHSGLRINNISYNGTTVLLSDGNLDTTYTNKFQGFSNVYDSIVASDGSVYLCGIFGSYNGQTTSNGLIKLKPDLTVDNTFNNNINFTTSTFPIYPPYNSDVEILSENNVVVGGRFTIVNGITYRALLNVTGLNINNC